MVSLKNISIFENFGSLRNQASAGIIPEWLVGDERRFKQVLINLIKNALKFTPKGSIEVKTSYHPLENQMLKVQVIDTGVGIAAEDMAALFTRFGKLQRTADMNNEGIGLGLTIVE